jgi:hypothetical protein
MTSSTTTHNGQHESPLLDYDAKEKDYESLVATATARNKTAVFNALAKASIRASPANGRGCRRGSGWNLKVT